MFIFAKCCAPEVKVDGWNWNASMINTDRTQKLALNVVGNHLGRNSQRLQRRRIFKDAFGKLHEVVVLQGPAFPVNQTNHDERRRGRKRELMSRDNGGIYPTIRFFSSMSRPLTSVAICRVRRCTSAGEQHRTQALCYSSKRCGVQSWMRST